MKELTFDTAGRTVTLENDTLQLVFDEVFGGAPLLWTNKVTGKRLVNPFPGEGCNQVFDSGNDGTQASPDGLLPNPIAHVGGDHSYYGSGTLLGCPWDNCDEQCTFESACYMPFFWMSHEAIDDSIPTDPRGDHGWNTKYHNFLNLPVSKFSELGVPLIFASRPGVPSGMILIGDEIKSLYVPGTAWNERYCKITDGYFAASFNVSLKDAPADAIAGFFFRKEVPAGAGKDINDLYNANGYQLNFNKAGTVELRKNGSTVIFTGAGYAPQLNSTAGLSVEIRSVKADLGATIEIILNGVKFKRSAGGIGNAFGFFAQCSSGQIVFTNRAVYDLNIAAVQAWNAYDDKILCISAVELRKPIPLYRLNLPVIFLDVPIRSMWSMKDNAGNKYNSGEAWPPGHTPGTFNLDQVSSIWIGQSNKVDGLFFENIEGSYTTIVDGHTTLIDNVGHIGISPAAIAFNPLPYSANLTPPVVTSAYVSCTIKTAPPQGW